MLVFFLSEAIGPLNRERTKMQKQHKTYAEQLKHEQDILARNARLAKHRHAKACAKHPDDEIAQQCECVGAQVASNRGRLLTLLLTYECGEHEISDLARELDLSEAQIRAALPYLAARADESRPYFRYVLTYEQGDTVTVSPFRAKVSVPRAPRVKAQGKPQTTVVEAPATLVAETSEAA